jgi:hypothetical protein
MRQTASGLCIASAIIPSSSMGGWYLWRSKRSR